MTFCIPDAAALDAAFCDICEEVTFALLDPVAPAEVAAVPGPHYRATVTFDGDLAGAVSVAGDLPGITEMAGNLLPTDPADPQAEEHAIRFLEELANITAGVFSGLITAEEGACDFGTPTSAPLGSAAWKRLCHDPASRCYQGDDGPLVWHCSLSEPATGRHFRVRD